MFVRVQEIAKSLISTNDLITDTLCDPTVEAFINDEEDSSPPALPPGLNVFHEPISTVTQPDIGVANTGQFNITLAIELANELCHISGHNARRQIHFTQFNRQIVSWLAAKLVLQTAADEHIKAINGKEDELAPAAFHDKFIIFKTVKQGNKKSISSYSKNEGCYVAYMEHVTTITKATQLYVTSSPAALEQKTDLSYAVCLSEIENNALPLENFVKRQRHNYRIKGTYSSATEYCTKTVQSKAIQPLFITQFNVLSKAGWKWD